VISVKNIEITAIFPKTSMGQWYEDGHENKIVKQD